MLMWLMRRLMYVLMTNGCATHVLSMVMVLWILLYCVMGNEWAWLQFYVASPMSVAGSLMLIVMQMFWLKRNSHSRYYIEAAPISLGPLYFWYRDSTCECAVCEYFWMCMSEVVLFFLQFAQIPQISQNISSMLMINFVLIERKKRKNFCELFIQFQPH